VSCYFLVCVVKHSKNYNKLALKTESMRGVKCKTPQATFKKDADTQKFSLCIKSCLEA